MLGEAGRARHLSRSPRTFFVEREAWGALVVLAVRGKKCRECSTHRRVAELTSRLVVGMLHGGVLGSRSDHRARLRRPRACRLPRVWRSPKSCTRATSTPTDRLRTHRPHRARGHRSARTPPDRRCGTLDRRTGSRSGCAAGCRRGTDRPRCSYARRHRRTHPRADRASRTPRGDRTGIADRGSLASTSSMRRCQAFPTPSIVASWGAWQGRAPRSPSPALFGALAAFETPPRPVEISPWRAGVRARRGEDLARGVRSQQFRRELRPTCARSEHSPGR